MRKTLLTLSLLFILKIGYSQNSNYQKNEISIGVISLIESPKNQKALFENSYYFVPFSNLTYKRFLNEKNAVRFSYNRPINKSFDKSGGDWIDKDEYKEQVFKIGYEYIFNQKRFTPYIAIDLTYLKSSSSRESGGGFTGNSNRLEREMESFGLSPVIGINYKIYKNILLGLESNLSIMNFNETKVLSTYQLSPEPNEVRVTEKDNYIEYIFNPIVFLIKIRFQANLKHITPHKIYAQIGFSTN